MDFRTLIEDGTYLLVDADGLVVPDVGFGADGIDRVAQALGPLPSKESVLGLQIRLLRGPRFIHRIVRKLSYLVCGCEDFLT